MTKGLHCAECSQGQYRWGEVCGCPCHGLSEWVKAARRQIAKFSGRENDQ